MSENLTEDEMKATSAATKIQAGFRGYRVRKQLKDSKSRDETPSPDITNVTTCIKGQECRRASLEEKSATKIQAGIRGFLVRKRQQVATAAATRIQAGFRGFRTRKALKQNAKQRDYRHDPTARSRRHGGRDREGNYAEATLASNWQRRRSFTKNGFISTTPEFWERSSQALWADGVDPVGRARWARRCFLEIRLCQPTLHRVFRPAIVHPNDNPIDDLRRMFTSNLDYRRSCIRHCTHRDELLHLTETCVAQDYNSYVHVPLFHVSLCPETIHQTFWSALSSTPAHGDCLMVK